MCLMTGVGAAATSFLSGGPAFAGDNVTVAVLGLEAGEGAPDSVAVAITESLRQRVSAISGYRLVQGRDLVEVKLVFSCPDEAPVCMGQAAKSLGAARLIFGSVKNGGADGYSVTLKLFDAEKEVVESWTTDQISPDQASPAALRAPVQKWIATLTGRYLPGTLHVLGGVVGASVTIDGIAAGVLGAGGLTIANVAAGTHELVVSKPGYSTAKKSVTLVSGDTREVAVELTAVEPPLGPVEAPPAETAAEPAATAPLAPTEPGRAELTSSGSRGAQIALIVTSAAALVGAGVGLGVGIYYSRQVNKANSLLDPFRRYSCPGTATGYCDQKGNVKDPVTDDQAAWMRQTKSLGDRYEKYQWIGYGIGGGLLATSAVLFYLSFVEAPSDATADARGTSLHFAPVFSHEGPGAMAFMTF